jgi:hypothetical protein
MKTRYESHATGGKSTFGMFLIPTLANIGIQAVRTSELEA